MGRAARHVTGQVILYADTETKSIKAAVGEVSRRRETQIAYNAKHSITPVGVQKPIRERLVEKEAEPVDELVGIENGLTDAGMESLTPMDREKKIRYVTRLMREASASLEFEKAAYYRDLIAKLK
jgi:excinuclease ABC subunit B